MAVYAERVRVLRKRKMRLSFCDRREVLSSPQLVSRIYLPYFPALLAQAVFLGNFLGDVRITKKCKKLSKDFKRTK